MLKSIAGSRLKSKIKRDNTLRKKEFKNWEKIQKIALILSDSDLINKSAMDRFIENSQKYIDVYFIELRSKQVTYSDWTCFSRKDKNAWGLPHSKLSEHLQGKKYDLVINSTADDPLFSSALTAGFDAPCKCGCSEAFGVNDLIVKRQLKQDLFEYLNEVIRYLKMIRN